MTAGNHPHDDARQKPSRSLINQSRRSLPLTAEHMLQVRMQPCPVDLLLALAQRLAAHLPVQFAQAEPEEYWEHRLR